MLNTDKIATAAGYIQDVFTALQADNMEAIAAMNASMTCIFKHAGEYAIEAGEDPDDVIRLLFKYQTEMLATMVNSLGSTDLPPSRN